VRIVVAVVALHGVDHGPSLAVLLEQIATQLEVGAVHFAVHCLADVVEQPGPLGRRLIDVELGCHVRRKPGDFQRVLERVLPVGRAELEPAQQLVDLGMEVRNVGLQRRGLAVGEEFLVHLGLDLGDQFLDPSGMDPPVLDQVDQRQPRDLAAHRFEARQDHRLGGVVDDEVDPRGLLEGADVASLAADDSALHLVRREVDHAHGAFDHVLGRDPLDRHGDDAPGLLLGLLGRLVLDPFDHTGSPRPCGPRTPCRA
jgi:hypothetical protein